MRWRRERSVERTSLPDAPCPYSFRGYEIPLDLLQLTGGGPETFEEIVQHHHDQHAAYCPFEPHHVALEIGCGIGRDAIPLTEVIRPPGRYIGTDIIEPSIEWCQAEITTRHPHFQFHRFDVHDHLHNPHGTLANAQVRLPAGDGSVDRLIAHSVFTHLFADEVGHYLVEIARVLADDGRALVTAFVVDEHLSHEPSPTEAIAIRTAHTSNCFVHDPAAPRAATGFTAAQLTDLAEAAGLHLDIERGNWSGLAADPEPMNGQDVLLLHRD